MKTELTIEWKGCHLESLANKRENKFSKSGRASEQRQGMLLRLANKLRTVGLKAPFAVEITRIGPRKLDSDNLSISAKHVRDGVADALGVDDGDETKIQFTYQQEKAKGYAVRVAIKGAS
ncbi:MAG: hypothetical protein WC100_03535 [Sterolibacterium sp.]